MISTIVKAARRWTGEPRGVEFMWSGNLNDGTNNIHGRIEDVFAGRSLNAPRVNPA
jgi:hypothetical protein